MIVVVFGLPGSGKSYFSSHLAEQMNAEYISSDRLRMEMFQVRTYTETEKLSVYDKMLLQLTDACRRKKDVVLDGTFYKAGIRNKFLSRLDGRILFIEVKAGESVIRERLSKPRPYSEAGFEVYEEIKGQWEPLAEEHLILESTDNNLDEMLSKAMAYIDSEHDER